MYSKLINNMIQNYQSIDIDNGGIIINPTNEDFIKYGYKLVIFNEKPVLKKNEVLIQEFDETETNIIINYKIKTFNKNAKV